MSGELPGYIEVTRAAHELIDRCGRDTVSRAERLGMFPNSSKRTPAVPLNLGARVREKWPKSLSFTTEHE